MSTSLESMQEILTAEQEAKRVRATDPARAAAIQQQVDHARKSIKPRVFAPGLNMPGPALNLMLPSRRK